MSTVSQVNSLHIFVDLPLTYLLTYFLTYLLRLRSSHSCCSIGRRDFSTDSDHWPLCEHRSSWVAPPVNLPRMFVARSFLDVLFFSCLHQVPLYSHIYHSIVWYHVQADCLVWGMARLVYFVTKCNIMLHIGYSMSFNNLLHGILWKFF